MQADAVAEIFGKESHVNSDDVMCGLGQVSSPFDVLVCWQRSFSAAHDNNIIWISGVFLMLPQEGDLVTHHCCSPTVMHITTCQSVGNSSSNIKHCINVHMR